MQWAYSHEDGWRSHFTDNQHAQDDRAVDERTLQHDSVTDSASTSEQSGRSSDASDATSSQSYFHGGNRARAASHNTQLVRRCS